ncbi:MAG: serine/threonine protein kinase [bacterium]|nr:MAG: serine/threonine protein kinase [bacterium]
MNQEEKRLIQNKYEIVSKIKQGGFGIVYKGYDHVFEKPVAIKAIEPSLLREAKYIDLFLEEAKNAGKLSHNNIVHIYNLVRDENGQFFIIMEYVDGMDLGKILRQCRKKNILIPKELSIFIVKEICKALEYAHNKRDLITDKPLRLVHQDISPSNIMASLSGDVKLIDFGLAKIRFQNNNSNEIVVSGKLPYMTPEQVNGGTIDRRTDIFSLGTVFYEMLVGARLFPLDDPHQTIELIKKCRFDTSLLDKNNVPTTVQQILLKMLQKDPENRYHGANGVYLDLVECLMTTAHSVELSGELGEFVRQIIDSNGIVAVKPTSDLPYDKADGEDRIEPQYEAPQPLLQEEGIKETSEQYQFEIKEPEKVIDSLSRPLPESISETVTDSEKEETVELSDTKDLKSRDSADPSVESIDASGEGIPSPDIELPDSFTESQIESLIEDEKDSESIENKLVEDIPTSISEKDETVPLDTEKEISDEIKKIFDSDVKSKTADIGFGDRSKQETIVKDDKRPVAPHLAASIYSEEEGEDDLKTVIDVIRLSTSRHKKLFTIAGVSVVSAIILFLIFDIMLQITSFGEGIYNRLFPPAIKISSIPTGATVYIDNKRVPGKTPLSIPKIFPGVHELKLTYADFDHLIKSIHVPSKGEVKVAGEKIRKGHDPYLFRFKSQIDINSNPGGATVYINKLLYPHKTPTTIEWEVGNPISIEMEQDGFQKLSGFTLNTLDGIEEIDDRRLWSFNTMEGEYRRYVVEGIFKKFIKVTCIPTAVNFYIDGSPTPSGRTDVSNIIALTMGRHEIQFQKAGFNSRRVRLNVDKNAPESISVMLTRNVRFFAKDKNDLGNNEIGATIVTIIQNRKSYRRNDRTPCEISLPPVNLRVVLRKDGYKDAIVNVSPRDKDVVVRMEPSIVDVEIIVLDALTGLPLKDSQIGYRSLRNDQATEDYFGATDGKGRCIKQLAPGEYSFKVKKFGYFEKYAILNTKAGENKLEFRLIIQ